MSDLYDSDIVTWSERQADLLRRLAAGEAPNEVPDWGNIIEEIESVGSEQVNAVRALLVQALLHRLKAKAWPLSAHVPHWEAEARGFRGDAADRFVASMRQKIDMTALYRRALRRMPDSIDGQPPLPVPEICEWTLDHLLSEDDSPV